jgi:hypothetical protein
MEYKATILSSSEISHMDRDSKQFSGFWNDFFGKPQNADRWPAAMNFFTADANSLSIWLALPVPCRHGIRISVNSDRVFGARAVTMRSVVPPELTELARQGG